MEKWINQRIAAGDPDLKDTRSSPDRVLIKSPAAKKPKAESDLKSVAMQGITFGGMDEILGGVGALGNAITAPFSDTVDFDPVGSYNKWRDQELERVAATREAHPWISAGMELTGGLLTGGTAARGVGALSSMKEGARAGAVAGGASGFLYGDGGVSNRAASAGIGAVSGGALGGAIPMVATGVNRYAVQPAMNYVKPGNGIGRGLVANALRDDNITPSEAVQSILQARQNGVPLTLADMGDNVRGLAGSVSRRPGPARRIARETVIERQSQQGERVREAIARDLGPIADVPAQSEALIQRARAAAAPLYEEAYAAPAIGSATIDELLQTPAGRSALSRARTIAANERRDPAALGFAVDDQGEVILNPVAHAEFGAQAAARSAVTDAQEAYRAARASGGDANGARQALLDAREALRTADTSLAGTPAAGTAQVSRQYTPQTLDYVKRGLDDVVEQFRDPVTRRLNLDEAGRAINDVRANFVSEVDALNPAYAQARQAYQGPARERDALQLGRQAITASGDDVGRMTDAMTAGELEQFALGYRSALAETIDRRVDGADKVQTLLGSPRKRESVARAVPQGDFERFGATMDAERAANETYRSIATGSPTANRLADDELTSDTSLLEDAAGRVIRGGAQSGSAGALVEVFNLYKEARKFGAGQAGQRAREDAAALLFQSDPALVRDLLRDGLRAQAKGRASERRLGAGSAYLGKQAGRMLGGVAGYTMVPLKD